MGSDGTNTGTVKIENVNISSQSYSNANGGGLGYFAGDDGIHGMELWRLGEYAETAK